MTDCELTSSIERKQPHSYEIQQKAKKMNLFVALEVNSQDEKESS